MQTTYIYPNVSCVPIVCQATLVSENVMDGYTTLYKHMQHSHIIATQHQYVNNFDLITEK